MVGFCSVLIIFRIDTVFVSRISGNNKDCSFFCVSKITRLPPRVVFSMTPSVKSCWWLVVFAHFCVIEEDEVDFLRRFMDPPRHLVVLPPRCLKSRCWLCSGGTVRLRCRPYCLHVENL